MWFLPATGVAVALSALGWWGISFVASDVANRVVDALGWNVMKVGFNP